MRSVTPKLVDLEVFVPSQKAEVNYFERIRIVYEN